jgi:D-arabinose 1-dehydrogenase-like Zn-dependent alcohol dehydrogenase
VPATALARVPDGVSATQATPMACAGVTVFGAPRLGVARVVLATAANSQTMPTPSTGWPRTAN